jgi:hypothetical protein
MILWRVTTRIERFVAAVCLALRVFSILVLESTSACRRAKDSALGATTGQYGPYLVRGKPSRVGCGGGVPRIVHFAKRDPRKGEYTTGSSRML